MSVGPPGPVVVPKRSENMTVEVGEAGLLSFRSYFQEVAQIDHPPTKSSK